jgi:hypothetical protein
MIKATCFHFINLFTLGRIAMKASDSPAFEIAHLLVRLDYVPRCDWLSGAPKSALQLKIISCLLCLL